MLYLVKLTDVQERDVQDPEAEGPNQGWSRDSTEGEPCYHVLDDKGYEDCLEQCIPDNPDHYTRVELLGKWTRQDLAGVLVALVPKDSVGGSCDGGL